MFIPPPTNNTAPDPNFYDAGVTVSHDVVNTNFSTSCCYVCACIVGYGNPLGYGNLDCDDLQPGAGPEQGQANCWVNCNKQPSDSLQGMPCPICAVNPDDTWECTLNGCEDSICDYSPTGLGPSYTILDWQRDNNCYSADTCGGECRAACTCDTGTTMNVCVMLQEVQLGNLTTTYGPDVAIPTVYGYLSMNSCDFMASFPGIDCCDTVENASFACDGSADCLAYTPTAPNISEGYGCYQINPGDVGYPGPYRDDTLIAPYLTPLDMCEAACTWECINNTGCNFAPYATPANLNNAHDCYLHYGPDCTTCNEKWFCLSSQTSSPCVTETYMLSAGDIQKHQALGVGKVAYSSATNMDNIGDAGFLTINQCEQHCRFCCDGNNCTANPLTTCALFWNDPLCYESIDDCSGPMNTSTGIDGNCCWDEWYCENDSIGNGCMGYDIGAGPIPPAGSSGPYTEYTACTQYCGYVCGDNFDIACYCRFHNDDSLYQLLGTDVPLFDAQGVWIDGAYPDNTTCLQLSNTIGVLGGLGCCDCYDCYIQGSVDWGAYMMWGMNFYTPGQVQTVANIITPDADPWIVNDSWFTGQTVRYESPGGSNCCYVFVAGSGAGNLGGSDDPYTWWTTYMADYALSGSFTSAGPTAFGLDDPGGFSTTVTWGSEMRTPTLWVPCDCNCPGLCQ